MREALGRLRECMEFAVGNQLITVQIPPTIFQDQIHTGLSLPH